MLVKEIMSTDIVTVDIDESVAAATRSMLTRGVGSVIVVEDGTPRGLVTESDALQAALETDRPISEVPLRSVMTSPVKTIGPTESLLDVAQKMKTHEVKRFPVMDRIDLVGIVTFSDLIWEVSDLVERNTSEDDFFSEPV
jgi:CBS domain-containing protein